MNAMETTATMNANRTLIEARLDAIDRALLGRLSRGERLDVVGEVESRIDDLLRERCGHGGEPSREDVLAVLARLDPPEAFLGDETISREVEERRASPARVAFPLVPASDASGPSGSMIVGVVAACLAIIFPVGWAVAFNNPEFLIPAWLAGSMAMMLGGGLAVVLGWLQRPRRLGEIVGMIVGSAAFGFGLAGAGLTLLLKLG